MEYNMWFQITLQNICNDNLPFLSPKAVARWTKKKPNCAKDFMQA